MRKRYTYLHESIAIISATTLVIRPSTFVTTTVMRLRADGTAQWVLGKGGLMILRSVAEAYGLRHGPEAPVDQGPFVEDELEAWEKGGKA